MRLLVWLLLALLVVLALRKSLRRSLHGQSGEAGAGEERSAPAAGERPPETMVCCAHCQLHVPASEAVYRGDKAYCCEAHAQMPAADVD
jgi:uncharacterized protein